MGATGDFLPLARLEPGEPGEGEAEVAALAGLASQVDGFVELGVGLGPAVRRHPVEGQVAEEEGQDADGRLASRRRWHGR
jgi:hypothetical protein